MTRYPEDWDDYALGLLGDANLEWAEMIEKMGAKGFGWHLLMKAILNDYWMDNGSGPEDNFERFDAERMNQFVAKLYYCWVQMLRAQRPDLFEDENEGLVE